MAISTPTLTSPEVEEYSHKHAMHVAQFVCPRGHLNEERRIWEPVPADASDL
jgi:hypothetical protein